MRSRVPLGKLIGTDRSGAPRSPSETLMLAAGIVALLLLVGIGSTVLAATLSQLLVGGPPPSRLLIVAFLLNIALILMGWQLHLARREAAEVADAAEQRARALAAPDPLATLLDRAALASEGAALIERAARRRGTVAMLVLDLDDFKAINDMHGQPAGDAVLRCAAIRILETMPPGTRIARTGGDAFACVLPIDHRQPGQIGHLAERLLARLSQPVDVGGVRCEISTSIGIARSGADCPSIKALMRAADIALYTAKRSGRDRFVWFDRSMERELHSRNDLEEALRTAIPQGQILPFFEQQIDLVTGDLDGFEVLARWQHPARGLLEPESFLPLAEDTGLVGELTLTLMRQAFEAARDWDPSLCLSINLSRCQLRDAWLAQKILKLLTETGFPAHRLQVEVTEGALFDNLPLAQSTIGSLKNQGVRVALDNFGTGYSSLAHLRALPLDRIKIDASLIGSMAHNADATAIVNAITHLGESLNLSVAAQGIPDAAVEARLRGLGCAKGQGPRYGTALSNAGVRRMLAERRQLVSRPSPDRPTVGPRDVTNQRRAG
jgi:diguanylate cyclase (GGDEF)-like protein